MACAGDCTSVMWMSVMAKKRRRRVAGGRARPLGRAPRARGRRAARRRAGPPAAPAGRAGARAGGRARSSSGRSRTPRTWRARTAGAWALRPGRAREPRCAAPSSGLSSVLQWLAVWVATPSGRRLLTHRPRRPWAGGSPEIVSRPRPAPRAPRRVRSPGWCRRPAAGQPEAELRDASAEPRQAETGTVPRAKPAALRVTMAAAPQARAASCTTASSKSGKSRRRHAPARRGRQARLNRCARTRR